MRDLMAITRALADANRVRALMALRDCELCVCQIIEILGLAPSTVSKHLSVLEHARLVEKRKCGRWMYYHLPGKEAQPVVRGALRWLARSLSGDRQAAEDNTRLAAILKIDPEDLCSRQRRS